MFEISDCDELLKDFAEMKASRILSLNNAFDIAMDFLIHLYMIHTVFKILVHTNL